MDTRKVVLLVGALFVAAITAFFARTLITGSAAPQATAMAGAPAPVDGPKVLVAIRALPVGTIIDPTAVKFQPWPKELVEGAYFQEGAGFDMKNVVGTVVRNAITAGQPITQGALVKPGDRGFLAAALGPGMRAVTVPVSAQTSVAGFIFPGDRVDLLLSQSVTGGGDGPPLKTAETILRNLRVLATDQRTADEKDEKGNTVVHTFSTVTLETTPKIAEQIAVAESAGTLSLSLRSIADNQAEFEQAIAAGAVKAPANGDPKAERALMLQVASQPQAGDSSVTVGADVSRFQRRTVPGKASDGAPQGAQGAGGNFPGGAPVFGPVVRVARGNTVTDVPVGGKH
ncbi:MULTISPECIES: Flp pilus assembly protein CpaB [unclassified Sphingomonas]|uniref:Flp pilus assembly protein CpaB n=1 Tax=unclassified Sphingomonas TaxID=196159 RepID=UPI00092654A4|nr:MULTISPECIES: Flp pilus assembly protein CpaB [unclassified Sphingomonas]MBN8848116.1 Flp pilus assembly protein CpaB [Sphingomonas sp.]MBS0283435.1 Flp pilus assembly protein CpaB [Pseudomonadota bacterium]OJV31868.1 MAG: Flp pilus assembly protein CpaB [Sphingomonas sp. 67-36]